MKEYVFRLLKNLAHPGTIIGLVVAAAIPFLVYLGPNVDHKETIRQLDLYLPLPLFCDSLFPVTLRIRCLKNKHLIEDWD